MSRIYEALEKARKEKEKLAKTGIGIGAMGTTPAPSIVPFGTRKETEEELQKHGLVYRISPVVLSYHAPKCTIAEEYRIMRTNFLSMAQDGGAKRPVKSVVISSSNHREGKSVTAVNLSIALAQEGQQRVLLVDCDFRKPSIRKLMGIKPKHDLISVLTKDIPLEKAIIPTPVNNLEIMVVNTVPSNPAELIGSTKMKKTLAALRKTYDYVIYDSPPIMAVTDAVVLGAEVDGLIMVLQARRTQRERIRDAEDLLRQARANLLGFVLTNVRSYIPRYLNRYRYYTTYKYVE